ncbi:YIP1 family protein [Alisedimentitalea sp. MJ-SS2]|uniref:YIP1 family protein n=1 Tax=Aliisedimentitalea sp. MJ-SS2 TaxID=3049795 RepID=UPI00290F6DFA|nr:YIP1 family protein [Alisedimentitalea sp. MJ-SS2]MDU8926959.1 YIP1 family protein [Alisedimentitalea sp. MJ-SS2]
MSIVADIAATYRGPRRVIRRILDAGVREDRALITLMVGCIVVFVAQWPRLSREAHLNGEELNVNLGATLFAWLLIMPLVFYTLALISHFISRALGGHGTPYGARIALFWALLATGPVMLLWGLMAGFAGPGPGLTLVGVIWLAAFLWFWLSGLIEARH